MIKTSVSGSNEISFVTAVHPINGGNAPDNPPITIFCGVAHFK